MIRSSSTGTYGTDAVRWWLLRDVPRAGDVDFTIDRLVARANEDLANGLGNLISRVSDAGALQPGRGHPAVRGPGRDQPVAGGGRRGPAAPARPRTGRGRRWPARRYRAGARRGADGAGPVRLPDRDGGCLGDRRGRRTGTWR